jgi:hypothetical protein
MCVFATDPDDQVTASSGEAGGKSTGKGHLEPLIVARNIDVRDVPRDSMVPAAWPREPMLTVKFLERFRSVRTGGRLKRAARDSDLIKNEIVVFGVQEAVIGFLIALHESLPSTTADYCGWRSSLVGSVPFPAESDVEYLYAHVECVLYREEEGPGPLKALSGITMRRPRKANGKWGFENVSSGMLDEIRKKLRKHARASVELDLRSWEDDCEYIPHATENTGERLAMLSLPIGVVPVSTKVNLNRWRWDEGGWRRDQRGVVSSRECATAALGRVYYESYFDDDDTSVEFVSLVLVQTGESSRVYGSLVVDPEVEGVPDGWLARRDGDGTEQE